MFIATRVGGGGRTVFIDAFRENTVHGGLAFLRALTKKLVEIESHSETML